MHPFILRLLLPAPLGAIGLLFALSLRDLLAGNPPFGPGQDWLLALLLFTFYGYFFAGLPSLAFAVIMRAISRRECGSSARLLAAGLIGALSGTGMGLLLGEPLLGTAVGLIVGLVIEAFTLRLDPPFADLLAAVSPRPTPPHPPRQ